MPNKSDSEIKGDQSEMFSSRQKALAGKTEFDSAFIELPNTAITKITYANIQKVQDMFPNMQARLNTFSRTRVSFQSNDLSDSTSQSFDKLESRPLGSSEVNQNRSASLNASSDQYSNSSLKNPQAQRVAYARYVTNDEVVLFDSVVRGSSKSAASSTAKGFLRSGPRRQIVWGEGEVRAAIAVCGGLCPGLNDTIEELFNCLYYNYGVDIIYGVKNGFSGFWQQCYQPWERLTPMTVRGISGRGGCLLGTGLGGFDAEKILNACDVYGINQLFLVGGDGTHQCATTLLKLSSERQMKLAMAVVPKSLDNDLGLIDGSFGFNTAVAVAAKAIESVLVESMCAPNGIGIVTLMGQHAGYIASHAVLASREADLCLIPEVPFQLEGPNGVFAYIKNVLDRQGYAVIVVAEGAGTPLVEAAVCKDIEKLRAKMLSSSGTGSADANTTFNPSASQSFENDFKGTQQVIESARMRAAAESSYQIESVLKRELGNFFKRESISTNIRCVDPGYMIRSVDPSAADAVMTLSLAQNAVHGTMAGYTGFSSAIVNNRSVMIPVELIANASPSYLSPTGRTWERVLSLTQQPTWPSYDKSVLKTIGEHTELLESIRQSQLQRKKEVSEEYSECVVDAVTFYQRKSAVKGRSLL